MAEIRMCGNEKCVQPVPPSLNPGVERIYCSPRCANATHQRRYRARYQSSSGDDILGIVDDRPFVRRAKAPTPAAAEARYKKHLAECTLNDGGPCIARLDPYDSKRECLIHAVLREDWDELRRAAEGRRWERQLTTENGFWKQDPEPIRESPAF